MPFWTGKRRAKQTGLVKREKKTRTRVDDFIEQPRAYLHMYFKLHGSRNLMVIYSKYTLVDLEIR